MFNLYIGPDVLVYCSVWDLKWTTNKLRTVFFFCLKSKTIRLNSCFIHIFCNGSFLDKINSSYDHINDSTCKQLAYLKWPPEGTTTTSGAKAWHAASTCRDWVKTSDRITISLWSLPVYTSMCWITLLLSSSCQPTPMLCSFHLLHYHPHPWSPFGENDVESAALMRGFYCFPQWLYIREVQVTVTVGNWFSVINIAEYNRTYTSQKYPLCYVDGILKVGGRKLLKK